MLLRTYQKELEPFVNKGAIDYAKIKVPSPVKGDPVELEVYGLGLTKGGLKYLVMAGELDGYEPALPVLEFVAEVRVPHPRAPDDSLLAWRVGAAAFLVVAGWEYFLDRVATFEDNDLAFQLVLSGVEAYVEPGEQAWFQIPIDGVIREVQVALVSAGLSEYAAYIKVDGSSEVQEVYIGWNNTYEQLARELVKVLKEVEP